MGDNFSNISRSTIVNRGTQHDVEAYDAHADAVKLAKGFGAAAVLDIIRQAVAADETLMGLTLYIRDWTNSMNEYAADGNAEGAAQVAGFIAVAWAVYRAELLGMA